MINNLFMEYGVLCYNDNDDSPKQPIHFGIKGHDHLLANFAANAQEMTQPMFEDFAPSTKEEWLEKAEKDLKGKPLDRLNWKTFEGNTVAPFYTSEDLAQYHQPLLPGQSPFVRSQKELSNGWLIREEIEQHKNFTATNKKAVSAIENGCHNLSFSIKASDEGFDGIPVNDLADLTKLLDNIDPKQTGISFRSGNYSPFYIKLLADWVKQQGHDPDMVFGSTDFDPISDFLASGKCWSQWHGVFDRMVEVISFSKKQLPHYKPLTLHSKTFQNSGASLVQELAYTLSLANEYLHQMENRNMDLETVHENIQIELASGTSYFQEIAKIRAMRWLWTSLTSQYSTKPSVQKAYIVSKTSEWNKTLYDPYVNMLRSTTEGMAAAIGGADEIQIDPYDKSFRPTSNRSERVARNVHHLLAHESHIDKSIDPSAGSYYIEHLTQQLANDAWVLFKKTEDMGGILAIAQNGQLQDQLTQSRKKREELLALRKEKFIGVNEYPNPTDTALDLVQQTGGRRPFKQSETKADNFEEVECIDHYRQLIAGSEGEKCAPLPIYMATEAFEQLRATVEVQRKEGKKLSSFFLLPLGNKVMRSARANFAMNLYQCGGFEVVNNSGFNSVQEGIEAFKSNPTSVIVICSSDDEYSSLIPEITRNLKKTGKTPRLVLAGHPGENKDNFEDLGIEDFIYAGMNIYQTLQQYMS